MATATTGKIRRNSLVIYRGSLKDFHGILFRVTYVEDYDGETRYTLAYRGENRTVLRHVRPKSVTRVAAKDILWRTCQKCGNGPFWYVRGRHSPCPDCRSSHTYWNTTVLGYTIEHDTGDWQRVIGPLDVIIGRVRETPDGWVHAGPQVWPRPAVRPCASRRTAVQRLIRDNAAAGYVN